MPSQSEIERRLIRRQTGDDNTSFPDADIDLLFDDAELEYDDYSRRVQRQAVIVYRKQELRAEAAAQVDYAEGQGRESLSDLYKHLTKEVEAAEAKLAYLIEDEDHETKPVVRILGVRRRHGYRERPHDH